MNIAGTVEQDIDRSHFGGKSDNGLRFADVQPVASNAGPIVAEGRKQRLVDVRGPDHRSLVGKRDGRGASNALSRCCN